jgi:aminoglycoside 6'-N-acetyltransferase
VRAWLQTPEVVRWWGDPAEQLELIREDLKDPRWSCVSSFGGRPFAFVQDYAVYNKHLPAGSRAIDAFVGEPDMTS